MAKSNRVAVDALHDEALNLAGQTGLAYAADKNTTLAFITEDLIGYYQRLGFKRVLAEEVEDMDSNQREPRELPYGMFAPLERDGFAVSVGPTGVPMYLMAGDKKTVNDIRQQRINQKSGILKPGAENRREIMASRIGTTDGYSGLVESDIQKVGKI